MNKNISMSLTFPPSVLANSMALCCSHPPCFRLKYFLPSIPTPSPPVTKTMHRPARQPRQIRIHLQPRRPRRSLPHRKPAFRSPLILLRQLPLLKTAVLDAHAGEAYILGPQDSLNIRVVDMEELGEEPYPIDFGGNITLPRIGRIARCGSDGRTTPIQSHRSSRNICRSRSSISASPIS